MIIKYRWMYITNDGLLKEPRVSDYGGRTCLFDDYDTKEAAVDDLVKYKKDKIHSIPWELVLVEVYYPGL